tara:strand:+ start:445 stop:1056 length:612 start_codon:yes stop_codon:yes gene_type:complete
MRSFSEIETTSKRASRAVGFPWGIAEEVGKNIRLLELFGFPGIKNLNLYYKNIKKEDFTNLKLINKDNNSEKLTLCPISLGVNFLDQIKTIEKYKQCTFQKIAYPILFLPFLSRGSEVIGKKILCEFDEMVFLLNFNINILSNAINQNYPLLAKNIKVSFLDNKDSFSEQEWNNLYILSENTFVEETDSLKKSAAGAGLTDND